MTDHFNRWMRVSRKNPCPICHRPDNCNMSADGQLVFCGRVSDGSISENGGGQYLAIEVGQVDIPTVAAPPGIFSDGTIHGGISIFGKSAIKSGEVPGDIELHICPSHPCLGLA